MSTGAEWDLVVVGAGPAGAATALAALRAAPRLRVLLLDRHRFPRDKSCGDGIAPHVFEVLAKLGAGDVAAGWTPLRRLQLAHGDTAVAGTMTRSVFVIPREVFDARLVAHAVGAGAELRQHRVRRVSASSDGVTVDDLGRATLVVGCDGAYSAVRQVAARPRTEQRAVAIRGYAPTPPDRRGLQIIRYGDRRQPCYAWSFDRGDGLSNVGYGELLGRRTGSGSDTSRALLLGELERLLPSAASTGSAWRAHHLPLSAWRWDQRPGRVLLAGDAAGLVNPLTGEGIYYAVATGALAGRVAAEAILQGDPQAAGERYRRALRGLLGAHLRHTRAAATLSRRPEVVDAIIRAMHRRAQAFDAVVELGLGDGRITPALAAGLLAQLCRRPAAVQPPAGAGLVPGA